MTVRLISQGKVSHYDDYLGFIRKWEDHVRQSPGTVRVKGYGDRESGTVYFGELMTRQSIDSLFLPTPTDHPGVNALLDQLGGSRFERLTTSHG